MRMLPGEQMKVLVSWMVRHSYIAKNSIDKLGGSYRETAENLWNQCLQEVNSFPGGKQVTLEQLRTIWSTFKSETKQKKAKSENELRVETGNGDLQNILTLDEIAVCELFNDFALPRYKGREYGLSNLKNSAVTPSVVVAKATPRLIASDVGELISFFEKNKDKYIDGPALYSKDYAEKVEWIEWVAQQQKTNPRQARRTAQEWADSWSTMKNEICRLARLKDNKLSEQRIRIAKLCGCDMSYLNVSGSSKVDDNMSTSATHDSSKKRKFADNITNSPRKDEVAPKRSFAPNVVPKVSLVSSSDESSNDSVKDEFKDDKWTVEKLSGKFDDNNNLDLDDHELSHVPNEIANEDLFFYGLKLGHNNIKQLPLFLFDLVLLNRLELQNNMIEEIPEQISQLRSLTHFNIASNRIKCFPIELRVLKGLKYLNVKNNPLEEEIMKIVRKSLQDNNFQQCASELLYYLDSKYAELESQKSLADSKPKLDFDRYLDDEALINNNNEMVQILRSLLTEVKKQNDLSKDNYRVTQELLGVAKATQESLLQLFKTYGNIDDYLRRAADSLSAIADGIKKKSVIVMSEESPPKTADEEKMSEDTVEELPKEVPKLVEKENDVKECSDQPSESPVKP